MESEIFKKLTEEYIREIRSDVFQEKKDEILDLLKNHNELSLKEYREIEPLLIQACENGDIEMLDIILSKEIENKSLGMTFKINKSNKTASLFKIIKHTDTIIIPRSINYDSEEYIITSVINYTNTIIKSLEFAPQSQVRTIYADSLKNMEIERLSIPDSLIELKEGWSRNANKLTTIIISPSNGQFIYDENKYLLRKSDQKSQNFDILMFARKDLTEAKIKSNIKFIDSHAFENCHNLRTVTFSKDSQLQIIGKEAFKGTNITNIDIPSSVTKICDGSFSYCSHLQSFKTEENSKLETIGCSAFEHSQIEEIDFPANLKHLGENWNSNTLDLRKINVSPKNDQFAFVNDNWLLGKTDPKSDNFDSFLNMCNKSDCEVTIPSYIKVIEANAFNNCRKLKNVYFEENSKLEIIGKRSFSLSAITCISIPKTVTKICDQAFCGGNLFTIEIPQDSDLLEIGIKAFSSSAISEIFIPPKVTTIGDRAFQFCKYLHKIDIPHNSNLKTIGEDAFENTQIKEIFIPQSFVEFKEGWSRDANKLTTIIISPLNDQFIYDDDKYLLGKSDRNSQNFDILIFARKDLTEANIKSNIKIIDSLAFKSCHNLRTVTFSKDSQLQIIGKESFYRCDNLNEISIPSTVTKICNSAFCECHSIQKIEIPKDSNLQIIENFAFADCNINEIYIPSTVTLICDYAIDCENLSKIEIEENSQLQTLCLLALHNTKIKEFYIPKSLINIEEGCFHSSVYLRKIMISPYNNHFVYKDNKYLICVDFDLLLFADCNIKKAIIPDNVKIIGSNAFSYSKASRISIPQSVTTINNSAFSECIHLRVVDIPENSQLQIICGMAFAFSRISQFYIPQYVETINYAFGNSIKIFEVADKSNLNLFTDDYSIRTCNKTIITAPNNR